jgi:galactitol-specific phosphotransferase system IIB component
MAKDIAASASVPESQLVVINNIIDINELEAQLRVVRKTIIMIARWICLSLKR